MDLDDAMIHQYNKLTFEATSSDTLRRMKVLLAARC